MSVETMSDESLARYYENCATVDVPEIWNTAVGYPMELAEQEPSQLARSHVGIRAAEKVFDTIAK